jgi:hypothetical protein
MRHRVETPVLPKRKKKEKKKRKRKILFQVSLVRVEFLRWMKKCDIAC